MAHSVGRENPIGSGHGILVQSCRCLGIPVTILVEDFWDSSICETKMDVGYGCSADHGSLIDEKVDWLIRSFLSASDDVLPLDLHPF